MALAGGGAFRTVRPSLHTRTNARVITTFFPHLRIHLDEHPDGTCLVTLTRQSQPGSI
jgi:hypothetical protein